MGYVYVVTLFRMHKIGRTDNLQRRMEQLRPATLVGKKTTNRSRDLEADLHKRFERKRLPQSEWFYLTAREVEECLQLMGLKPKGQSTGGPRRAKRATPDELTEYRRLAGLD